MNKLLLSAALLGGLASHLSAAVLAYEGFDYAIQADSLVGTAATMPNTAPVTGQNGGTGFGGAWTNVNNTGGNTAIANPNITAGLSYTDGSGNQLVTTGGSMFLDSTDPGSVTAAGTFGAVPWRNISTAFDAASSSTVYISLIGQQTATQARALNFAFFATAARTSEDGTGSVGAERFSLGHGTNNPSAAGPFTWDAFTGGGGNNGSSGGSNDNHSAVLASAQTFMVLRIDLNNNAGTTGGTVRERFRLYLNPSLSAEPGAAAVDFSRDVMGAFSEIDFIRPFAGNSNGTLSAAQGYFDELRVGTSWSDVTPIVPVPEPGAASLGLLALAGLLRRRR